MADVKFRVVRATVPAAGGTIDVTSSGIGTVRAVIGLGNNCTANDTVTSISTFCMGFMDRESTPNERCVSQAADDGKTTTLTGRNILTKFLQPLSVSGGSPVYVYTLDYNSWITDGVRLDVAVAPSSDTLATFILIGGANVTDSRVGSIAVSSSTASVTGLGFKPSMAFIATAATTGTSVSTDAAVAYGVAIGDDLVTQSNMSLWDVNSVSTSDVGGALNRYRANSATFDGSESWNLTVRNMNSDGFDIEPSANAGASLVAYLALEFDENPGLSLEAVDGPDSTGNWKNASPGFTPDFGMIFLSDVTTYDTPESMDSVGIYAFDATNEYSVAMCSQNGVSTTVAKSLQADSFHDLTGAAANLHVGSFSSFDDDGVTLNFTTAPGTSRKWAMLSVGPNPASKNKIVGDIMSNITSDILKDVVD